MAVLPLDSLPVGYRFRPTDDELVNHFLRLKINGDEDKVSGIRVVDLCKQEPWDLPGMSLIETNDDEWIFFCPIDRKYKNGRRSNRSTVGGYWKATGKDRLVKARRGTAVIGTKKTLVFYRGRAPKGEKTNWVIHEYCATSKELDGTKPGQGSFVLCKLMKKINKKLDGMQDENTESSNCHEVEENVSSPATMNSFSEDLQSEPVTPMVSAQDERLHGIESYLGENSVPDAPLLTESPNDSCIADDAGNNSIVQDFELQEMLRALLPDLTMEPLDGHGKIFSPLHPQMQVDNGSSSHNLQYPVANEVVYDQNGTNEQDIDESWDSILANADEYFCDDSGSGMNLTVESEAPGRVCPIESAFVKDNVYRSESVAEVTQTQNNERKAPLPTAMSVRDYTTPEIIASEVPFRSLGSLGNESLEHFVPLASASDQSRELFFSPEDFSHSSNAVDNDLDFGTGITLRTRQPHNQPSELQGNAPRRIRLQKKLQVGSIKLTNHRDLSNNKENHQAKSVSAKAEEGEEKHNAIVGLDAIIDETHYTSLSSTNNTTEDAQESGFSKDFPSASLEASPALPSISSSMNMLWVLMVVGLSLFFAGIWRCLEF